MDAKYQGITEKFENLMKRYKILFGEVTMLEDPDDIFYVSDPATYEIYHISGVTVGKTKFRDYQGRKCYELLQGRDEPCPFCTNPMLTVGQYYIWEHFNPVIKRHFLIKDGLFELQGRKLRMEVAQNVSNPERAKNILLETTRQQNLLMRWTKCMVEQDRVEDAFRMILKDLSLYFKAETGFVRTFTEVETAIFISENNTREIPFADMPDVSALKRWEEIIGENRLILIRSVDEIKDIDLNTYELLNDRGVKNLCLAPIFIRRRLAGFIGLGNLNQHWEGIPIIQALEDYMAAAIQKTLMREEKFRIQYTDNLTGYLNFEGFKVEVERILKENPDKNYALRYCDIKRFKFINEVYGYDTGDKLLRYWSAYISKELREREVFCRISADTVAVLYYYDNEDELNNRFMNMAGYLSDFPALSKKRLQVELACGIYLISRERESLTVGEMLNRANMAQKKVKDRPGSHVAYYTEEMRRKEIREMEFIASMQEALKNEEFLLYFQPQIAARPGRENEVRAEVLVRWRRDGETITMPGEFISLFERNGFIVDLDRYMFEHACRYLKEMEAKISRKLVLSVNVSRISMLLPNFVEDYCRIKDQYRVGDGIVELEFTENVAVEDVEYFKKLIQELKNHGFLCAMDDFGTGQSSLNALQALPLDILKLDQMFFRDKRNEQRKRIIVESVLKMARQLDMMTVAEGIESKEQVLELSEMGCDYIQGYYYSKPLPAAEFEEQYLEEMNGEI